MSYAWKRNCCLMALAMLCLAAWYLTKDHAFDYSSTSLDKEFFQEKPLKGAFLFVAAIAAGILIPAAWIHHGNSKTE